MRTPCGVGHQSVDLLTRVGLSLWDCLTPNHIYIVPQTFRLVNTFFKIFFGGWGGNWTAHSPLAQQVSYHWTTQPFLPSLIFYREDTWREPRGFEFSFSLWRLGRELNLRSSLANISKGATLLYLNQLCEGRATLTSQPSLLTSLLYHILRGLSIGFLVGEPRKSHRRPHLGQHSCFLTLLLYHTLRGLSRGF